MRHIERDFVNIIKSLSIPEYDKSDLVTRLLYASYMRSSNDTNSKIVKSYIESNEKIKEAYEYVDDPYLPKKKLKDICNKCIEKFRVGAYINIELYRLVTKLLRLKPSDLLLHVNAQDELFLLDASKKIKSGPLKINTYAIPDNDNASEMIRMRLEINETNYSNIDDIEKVTRFKPNKVFINPVYRVFDKSYRYSKRANTFWNDLLSIAELMTDNSRIVALVPNVMLSNSIYKDKKEKILKNGYLEGIISLPLRYYSNSLKVESSLLILSKGNEKVKILDINSVFTVSDIKFANLDQITEYIFERYNDDFTEVEIKDLIVKNSNLLISNIITSKTYQGMDNLTKLSTIADVYKGTKKTKVDFKDLIDQTGESPYALLSSNDINDGFINYKGLTRIFIKSSLEKYVAKNGDLVVTNKSSSPKLAVIECTSIKIIPTGSMIIISPHDNTLDCYYLKMFFESKKGFELLSKVQRGQKTTTLYPEDFKVLFIPYVDYQNQLQLVKNYKSKLSELAHKKAELDKIKKDIEILINYGGQNYDNE